MVSPLPSSARVVALLVGVALAALIFVPSLHRYRAHQLTQEAETHLAWGRLEAAQESVQQALTLTPLDAGLHKTLGDTLQRQVQWRQDPVAREAALAAHAAATALNPLGADLFAAHAEALMHAGRFPAAHAALAQALARDSNSAFLHTLAGRIFEAEGQPGRAAEAYQQAHAIKPSRDLEARLAALQEGQP
jgi:tetratricopeptide (TPR) repeat protein